MKRIFIIGIAVFLFLLFGAGVLYAQESSQSATTSHLTFPISELGNCNSAAECKTYCDDPTHTDACVAYAKEKGFYKEGALDSQKNTILEDAKTTLGCDTLDSCRTFCQQAVNADICSSFAQKHNLKGGKTSINNVTLQKAEAAFGCTSVDSCRAFCQDSANKTTCANFAKQNGLNGGNQAVGPGGCTSESSCKTFCSNPNNFTACQKFVEHKESASGSASSSAKSFTGPGGCASESACKSFCDQNPTICHVNPIGKSVPSATSAAHLENTSDCREHPEKCKRLPPVSGIPSIRPGDNRNTSSQSGSQNKLLTPRPSGTSQQTGEQKGNTPFPTVSQSVQGASTHQDFWSWLVNGFFHLK